MVCLTTELIARGCSGYTKRRRDESAQQFFKRLTHVYLENKGLSGVGDALAVCPNLVVLYLYDNQLDQIPDLSSNCNLTHLYLQNNNIKKICNLSTLTRLNKLYLAGNCITVVEGLENLAKLQEIHLENQRLPKGEQLLFDPRSIQVIADNVMVLNVSGNSLKSLADLRDLDAVTHLFASDNQLSDVSDLAELLATLPSLWRLELIGNPVRQKAKYKDTVIISCRRLCVLDGKEISDTARRFLSNWHASKNINKRTPCSFKHKENGLNQLDKQELPPISDLFNKINNTFSGYMMPGLPRKEFDDVMSRTGVIKSRRHSEARSGMFKAKLNVNVGLCSSCHGYAFRKPSASLSATLQRRGFLIPVNIQLRGN